jgi:Flp pilus assembly protein TadG
VSSNSHRRGTDEGATAVETAIVISALCTLIIGILEFGMVFWQWHTMLLAVEQTGRYAMINNMSITATAAEQQMSLVISGTASGTPACMLTGATINPPTAGNICVYATTATGTSPDPNTILLTAVYAYNILGISGMLTLTSQGVFPLD